MTAAAFLTDKQAEIEARAAALEEEARQLRAASAALSQLQGNPTTGAPIARRPARRKPSAAPPTRRTTGPGAGTRAQEALRLIAEHPGIAVPQLADQMGIKKNYLYRVVPGLEKAGQLRRVGEHGWALADAPADTPDANADAAATEANAQH
jgi:hypothetical protein